LFYARDYSMKVPQDNACSIWPSQKQNPGNADSIYIVGWSQIESLDLLIGALLSIPEPTPKRPSKSLA